jgi:hypothetical protein
VARRSSQSSFSIVGIVWAFYTGLAGKLVQKIIPPVEIAQIDKPKDVDKPPPPPPKLEEVKPFVPPPEFVDIQAAPQQTNAITETTQCKVGAAAVAAPRPCSTRTLRSRWIRSTRSRSARTIIPTPRSAR